MSIIRQPKRVLRSWDEKKILCEEWKISNKSKRDFCKEKNIPIATFFAWCNKLWPEEKKASRQLLPVKIKPCDFTDKSDQTEFEIILLNGSKLHFRLATKKIVSFIKELSDAATIIR